MSVTQLRIEQANGTSDGVNRDFFTSYPYDLTTSVQVFLDGQLLAPAQYMLIHPNYVRLVDAPRVGEVVSVYYQQQ